MTNQSPQPRTLQAMRGLWTCQRSETSMNSEFSLGEYYARTCQTQLIFRVLGPTFRLRFAFYSPILNVAAG